jgi:CheY-like chemotaxis protein
MNAFEILLVEDNDGDARLMREILTESTLSYSLSVVSDGIQAIAFLQHLDRYLTAPHPDLILLDLNLPLKNGMEVLDEIKKDAHLQSIPILLLSTLDERELFNGENLLADGFVAKPSDLSEFHLVTDAIQKLGFHNSSGQALL